MPSTYSGSAKEFAGAVDRQHVAIVAVCRESAFPAGLPAEVALSAEVHGGVASALEGLLAGLWPVRRLPVRVRVLGFFVRTKQEDAFAWRSGSCAGVTKKTSLLKRFDEANLGR